MNQVMLRSVIVIGLRHVFPLLGGAGLMGDDDYEQIAGALFLLGSMAYHVYKRYQQKKEDEHLVRLGLK